MYATLFSNNFWLELVDLLLDRSASVHARAVGGQSVLEAGIIYDGRIDVVTRLLDRGAHEDMERGDGFTAL